MYIYEIVSWSLLITAALRFTTQGCALPAPGWPVALNYCFRATRNFLKKYFHRNHLLGTQDFTGLELWAPFNFSKSTALLLLKTFVYLLTGWAVD